MPRISRRKMLIGAIGIGTGVATYGLRRVYHSIPPRDVAAEETFRRLQDALLARHAVRAFSRSYTIAEPPLKVHVIEAGDGPPVLMLHGGNSVAVSFEPLLGRLHRKFHVYAPDRPGCGLTDKFNYLGV